MNKRKQNSFEDARFGRERQEILYGRQSVKETFLANRRKLYKVFISSGSDNSEAKQLSKEAGLAESQIFEIERRELEHICGSPHHQGIAIETGPYVYAGEEEMKASVAETKKAPLILVLDHLEDPQNFGSIARTAECVGFDWIIIPADRAVPVTPAVVRASAGSVEHAKVCKVVNIVRTMNALKSLGLWFYGLDASTDSKLWSEADYRGATGLVVGGEGKGLGRLVRETCDFLVRLPMAGRVTSLNAGAASAAVMYEAVRQRQMDHGKKPEG